MVALPVRSLFPVVVVDAGFVAGRTVTADVGLVAVVDAGLAALFVVGLALGWVWATDKLRESKLSAASKQTDFIGLT